MAKIGPRIYAASLYQNLKDTAPKDHPKLIRNFLEYLFKKGQLKSIHKITNALEQYRDEDMGIPILEVTTAYPLTEKLRRQIKEQFRKTFNISQFNLEEKVEPKIIGGLVVRYGDEVLNVSLKCRLIQLKKSLTQV